MKKNKILLPGSSCFFRTIAIVCCAMLSFFATSLRAQGGTSEAPGLTISIEDLPHETLWKPTVDYSIVLASERANAAQTISALTTKDVDFALYTGYDRMLEYMQQDLIGNMPIEAIAEKAYKKVLAESPSSPILGNLESGEFNALYVALLGMLHL